MSAEVGEEYWIDLCRSGEYKIPMTRYRYLGKYLVHSPRLAVEFYNDFRPAATRHMRQYLPVCTASG